jgi:hypothetical protein
MQSSFATMPPWEKAIKIWLVLGSLSEDEKRQIWVITKHSSFMGAYTAMKSIRNFEMHLQMAGEEPSLAFETTHAVLTLVPSDAPGWISCLGGYISMPNEQIARKYVKYYSTQEVIQDFEDKYLTTFLRKPNRKKRKIAN